MLLASAAVASGAEKYTLHSFREDAALRSVLLRRRELRRLQSRRRDGRRLRPVLVRRAEVHRAARVSTRPKPFDIAGYSENFFAFTHDVNDDGWTDIVIIGFPGEEAWWFENPQGKAGHWERHVMLAGDGQRIADVHRRHGRRPAGARVLQPAASSATPRFRRTIRPSRGRFMRFRRSAATSGSRTAWASAT